MYCKYYDSSEYLVILHQESTPGEKYEECGMNVRGIEGKPSSLPKLKRESLIVLENTDLCECNRHLPINCCKSLRCTTYAHVLWKLPGNRIRYTERY